MQWISIDWVNKPIRAPYDSGQSSNDRYRMVLHKPSFSSLTQAYQLSPFNSLILCILGVDLYRPNA